MWACDSVLANENLLWDLGWRYQERDTFFFFFFTGVLSWFDMRLELLVTAFPLLGRVCLTMMSTQLIAELTFREKDIREDLT